MKSLSSVSNATTPVPAFTNAEPVALHQMTRSLMNSFIPLAVAKKSFIINDVDPALRLQVDQQVLAFVVGYLLSNAISSTQSACIRIEGVKTPDGIQIRVRMHATNFYSTVSGGYGQILEAAYLLGGNIHIHNQCHEGMVISLSLAA